VVRIQRPRLSKVVSSLLEAAGYPDANKAQIQEAYDERARRGKPKGGRCGGPKEPDCNKKTNFEYQKEEESNRDMQHFWKDFLIGDFILEVIATEGAAALLGEGAGGAGPPGEPIPIRPPSPPVPRPTPPVPLPKAA
jgi:hypothetical protein